MHDLRKEIEILWSIAFYDDETRTMI